MLKAVLVGQGNYRYYGYSAYSLGHLSQRVELTALPGPHCHLLCRATFKERVYPISQMEPWGLGLAQNQALYQKGASLKKTC